MKKIKVRIDYSDGSKKFYAETTQDKPKENFGMGNEILEDSYNFKIPGRQGFFIINEDGYCVDDSCFEGCCDIVVIEGKENL